MNGLRGEHWSLVHILAEEKSSENERKQGVGQRGLFPPLKLDKHLGKATHLLLT